MSIITNVLAVLGVVLIIVLIVYVYRKYNDDDKKKTPSTPSFPPSEYMEEVGTKCPDLWTLGTNYKSSEKYQCKNTSGVPVNNKDCESTAVFSVMKKWPLNDKKRAEELKTRCDWIEKCGPVAGTPASWIGIDDLC